MNTRYSLEVWIGLARVRATENSNIFDGAKNAYVTILVLARSRQDFKKKALREFDSLDIILKRLEQVEKFIDRIKHYSIPSSTRKIARDMLTGNKMVEVLTFHTFD